MANDTQQHDEEALRKLLQSVAPDTTPPPGCEERLRLRLMAQVQARGSGPARRTGVSRKRVWTFSAASAAAATILAAFLTWWLVGGGVRRASADFAEVLRRVRQASTVAFDQILRVPGQPETRVRMLVARPGRIRVTWPNGKVSIFNHAERKCLTLRPDTRKATLVRFAKKTTYSDPLDCLRGAEVSAGRLVGRESLDNREVLVYEVAQPQGVMRVFVDPQQQLPIRIEVRSRMQDGQEAVSIMENLSWNQPIPDSLFSFQVPSGYALLEPQSDPSESALIDLLRICARMRQGSFPARLDPKAVLELVLESHLGRGAPDIHTYVIPGVTDIDDQAKETYRTCLRGLAFIEQVRENGSWRYVGKGVTLGDATAGVCWWRLPGSASFRVVYGDLRVKDVSPERLPLPARRPALNPTDNGSPKR